MSEKVVTTASSPDEQQFELSLRPQCLDDFIGQDRVKRNLSVAIEAAKQRNEPIEHVLLYGAPGLGKTTLSHIIAREMGTNIRVTSGPAIERAGDLAAILTNLEPGDVLFIDEIHRLNKVIEETLYPAMEDYALDIVVGKGPSARTLRLELPRFTLIGATTKLSHLSAPMRDRFGGVWRLNFYSSEDIGQIVDRSSQIFEISLDRQALNEIARRSRRTPRIANRLLKHVRDYAQVHGDGHVTLELCQQSLSLLDVDEFGLDQVDRQLLRVIITVFGGGPVGVSSLAASSGEDTSTIEEVYEPYLLQQGFLSRTPRGRVATPAAYELLGLDIP